MSNGRVEFGTGESASHMELGGFSVDRGLKKSMWEEATGEICNMLSQTPYPGFEGEHFSLPERNVIPKPIQKPHPPLWVAASRRETTMVAARLGMGSLDPNRRDPNGRTALHLAAMTGARREVILALLLHGAKPAAKDKAGKTALALAVAAKKPKVVALLKAQGVKS